MVSSMARQAGGEVYSSVRDAGFELDSITNHKVKNAFTLLKYSLLKLTCNLQPCTYSIPVVSMLCFFILHSVSMMVLFCAILFRFSLLWYGLLGFPPGQIYPWNYVSISLLLIRMPTVVIL